ncbi:hypothetical protein KUCAC02_018676 [Chaenocephalus aceratus]|uniref:Uncharacterized protein n=1 Tax=Chaenocephalus aceratus TaxID=36190 RepID=A0ACB9WA52_CHAAC|nr:hypothetical protein KUCAC02_018676 [Chaenocephalus aceratus]
MLTVTFATYNNLSTSMAGSWHRRHTKTKTTPIFKPSSPQPGYQSNGGGAAPEVSDPEKIRLEQSYRERGEERGRARDTPLSVRISNV